MAYRKNKRIKPPEFTEELKRRNATSAGDHLDQSISSLEEARFKRKHSELIKQLTKELHFTSNEVESLLLIYNKFRFEKETPQPAMTRAQMKIVLQNGFDMTDSEMDDVVIYVMDKSPSNYFGMAQWLRTLSLFLRGSFDEKIEHCFKVYDSNNTGKITRAMMLQYMENCIIGDDDVDDVIRDFLEVVSTKMDQDRDGAITLEEFKSVIHQEPLLMEFLGQCIPSRLGCNTFLTTFTQYEGKF